MYGSKVDEFKIFEIKTDEKRIERFIIIVTLCITFSLIMLLQWQKQHQ